MHSIIANTDSASLWRGSFLTSLALITGLFSADPGSAATNAAPNLPLRSVTYINLYDKTKTFWPMSTDVYSGGGSVVQTVPDGNGFGLPIASEDGERAISIATIAPTGYWNILFKIQQHPVDLARIAAPEETPADIDLHLRIKWDTHLLGNAEDIAIDLQDDKNNHTIALPLSSVADLSNTGWQNIDVPFSKIVGDPAEIDLTNIIFIRFVGMHPHDSKSKILFSQIAVIPSSAPNAIYEDIVKVDQSGYLPNEKKRALVSFPSSMFTDSPKQFFVQNLETGQTVYTGDLKPTDVSPSIGYDESGDTVLDADFDSVSKSGTYEVGVVFPQSQLTSDKPAPNTEFSAPFRINPDVYSKEFRDLLRFYYYSRSGTPIENGFGEGFARPAEHSASYADHYGYPANFGNSSQPDGATRDVKGGWLDAGDKSVQTYSHVVAIWHLLNAYNEFGSKVPKGSMHLPESPMGSNDILSTVLYGIAWINKMTDADGGAHLMLRGDDTIEDVDSVTTANVTGAYAKAYVTLSQLPQYKTAAINCLTRAKKSWTWLANHPNLLPGADPDNKGQMYPLTDDFKRRDLHARAFAGVELFNATGDRQYINNFESEFRKDGSDPVSAFSGLKTGYDTDHVIAYLDQDSLGFAYWDYMLSSQTSTDPAIQKVIKNAFLHQADTAIKYQSQTGYDFAMLFPGHLYWGSNENVLSSLGIVFINAYKWTGDERYREAALNNLHFINGRNPVDRDFISGETDYAHGTDFYSQFWTDLTHQPPGYAGAFIDLYVLQPYIKDPWKRYINMQDASVCEPDVYWNCEVAYLAGYFSATLR